MKVESSEAYKELPKEKQELLTKLNEHVNMTAVDIVKLEAQIYYLRSIMAQYFDSIKGLLEQGEMLAMEKREKAAIELKEKEKKEKEIKKDVETESKH